MILMIYNREIYRDCLLPNLRNSNYVIELDKETYRLTETVRLRLDVSDHIWTIYSTEAYQMIFLSQSVDRHELAGGDILTVNSKKAGSFQIVAADAEMSLLFLQKFDIRTLSRIVIGKDKKCDIRYSFRNLVSASHTVISHDRQGFYVEDTSSNGTFCNSVRIKGRKYLQFGDQISIFGLQIIFLDSVLAVGSYISDVEVQNSKLRQIAPEKYEEEKTEQKRQSAGEERFFKRAPRDMMRIYTDPVEIEAPPAPVKANRQPLLLTIGPAFTMAIPMLLGCILIIVASRATGSNAGVFMYTGIVTAVSSALIGVIWGYMNMKYSRRREDEDEQYRFDSYSRYLIHITKKLRKEYQYNVGVMNRIYPSAVECIQYNRNNPNLWNRNSTHEDFLYIRLGVGSMPFQVPITVPKEQFTLTDDFLIDKPLRIKKEYQTLYNVPIGISLEENRLIGLVGGRNKEGARNLMYILVTQLAATISYTDLRMVFLYDGDHTSEREHWDFLRWLPHVWSEDHNFRFIAADASERGDVLYELGNLIRKREEAAEENRYARKRLKPHYVIFISDPSLLEGELQTRYLYHPKESYGITTFLLAGNVDQLPNVCEYIVQQDAYFNGAYHLMNQRNGRVRIKFDPVTQEGLEKLARTLADIRVKETEISTELPSSVDFFELYHAKKLTDFNIQERWRKNRTYDSMKVPIGVKAGGTDCYLDIHEKYHGPHGLLAGTTGSGKSETLQTYILSLALNFSPQDVVFFLIDFKGGGMANLFEKLPHLAGEITNLSGNQIQRAMISIKSENVRRQRIFARYDVNSINQYARLYKSGAADEPVPHLLIIIDEFAELKKEEPDFMKELISVAQVGRSLGVHLILATQKPSGTVDDNIWSNARFRICLRVQDRQDSNDMLRKPDAAYITQTGCGYLQVGNDELFEMFQSAYSGADYDAAEGKNRQQRVVLLTRTGKPAVYGKRQDRIGTIRKANGKNMTQLDAVIDYIREAARQADCMEVKKLWLPMLPRQIHLQELEGWSEIVYDGRNWPVKPAMDLTAWIGLYDDPENQTQLSLKLNLAECGNTVVFGSVVSGKSTLLQTVLYGLLMRYTAKELNVYILDYSSHMLSCFADANAVGGVISEGDEERLNRFSHMLNRIIAERKQLFKGGNYTEYVRANGRIVPAILIVIDNLAGFREKTQDRYQDQIMRIVREGIGYGIYMLISAGGVGLNDMMSSMLDHFMTTITLEQTDRYKYMEVLRSGLLPIEPENGIRGRGLAAVDGRYLEFQTAVALEADDDFSRSQLINEHMRALNRVMTGMKARRIPEIPENPVYADLAADPAYADAVGSGVLLPVGWDKNNAGLYSIDLHRTYCYLISGTSRTGRKTLMRSMMKTAAALHAAVTVIETEGISWKQYAEDNGFDYRAGEDGIFSFCQDLTPEFQRRNKRKFDLLDAGASDDDVFAALRKEQPLFVFIDDLNPFFETVYHPAVHTDANLSGFLETIFSRGSLHHIYFIGILRTEDQVQLTAYPAYKYFTEYHQGMHLGGRVTAMRSYDFSSAGYSELSKPLKRGVGIVRNAEDDSLPQYIVIPNVGNRE